MAQADADRDLLFVALAFREGLIDRASLLEARADRRGAPSASLPARLIAAGALGPGEAAKVWDLVDAPPDAPTVDGDATLIRPDSIAPGLPDAPGGDRRGEGPEPGPAPGRPGRYRIVRRHARGGLGEVFVAVDSELKREVALKQILERHADDPRSRARFLLEAEITGGLEHPGIVPVHGMGFDEFGRPYYAMRLLRGGTLKDAIARFHGDASPRADAGARSLALRELLGHLDAACAAVHYAHGRGVLHRDLKPSNIVVGEHGETVVLDWGLAKAAGPATPPPPGGDPVAAPPGDSAMTLDGSALGTPAFMSPEAAAGDLGAIDARTDVYGLGATLYCILAGRSPFGGDDLRVLIGQICAGDFPRPRAVDPAVDPALEAVCLKAMALWPSGRYGSAGELAGDLKRWAADEPVLAMAEGPRRRLARWVRRHASRVAAVSTLLATAAVTLGLAAALIAGERGRVAEARDLLAVGNEKLAVAFAASEKDRLAASRGLGLARLAIRRQLVDIAEFELPAIPQVDALRLKLAQEAAGLYRRIHLDDPANPRDRQDLIGIEAQVATLLRVLGRYPEARERYEAAKALLAPDTGPGASSPEAFELLSHVEGQIGELIRISGGRFAEAESRCRRAVELASGLSRRFPQESRYASLEARVAAGLASLLLAAGRPEEAEGFAITAAERGRAYQASLPAAGFSHFRLVLPVALGPRAEVLARLGRPDAERAYRELVGVLRDLEPLAPGLADVQYLLADALDGQAGVVAADAARRPEALARRDEAVDRMAPLIRDHPANANYPAILAGFRADRAALLIGLGRLDAARSDLDLALPVLRAEVGRVPGPGPLESLGRATADLARLAARRGEGDAARWFLAAIEAHEEALKLDPGALINADLLRHARADLDALAPPP